MGLCIERAARFWMILDSGKKDLAMLAIMRGIYKPSRLF